MTRPDDLPEWAWEEAAALRSAVVWQSNASNEVIARASSLLSGEGLRGRLGSLIRRRTNGSSTAMSMSGSVFMGRCAPEKSPPPSASLEHRNERQARHSPPA